MITTPEDIVRDAARKGERAIFTNGESIPAELIVELVCRAEGDDTVHAKGVQVMGATIAGRLDFDDRDLTRPLLLERCTVAGGIALNRARAGVLGFQDCPLIGGIEADSLTTRHSLFLRRSTVKGRVFLIGARVGGNFECDGATLDGNGNSALHADRLTVDGSVFLRHDFTSSGSVRLRGARIGGGLECDGATLNGAGGNALDGDTMTVAGNVFLRNRFTAVGSIRLVVARIGNTLDFGGATLDGAGSNALDGDKMTVDGGLFLRGGFTATGLVDLSHASVGVLCDSEKAWPQQQGMLELNGFTYGAIPTTSPQDAASRLRWLRLQPKRKHFDPQPYEQLAKVLRAQGHAADARDILIAKERDRRRHMTGLRKAWSLLLDVVVGYGYKPWLAARTAGLIIALGAAIFAAADAPGGYMVPAKERVYMDAAYQQTRVLLPEYPRLRPLVYSADLFLPFVDLRQEEFWLPSDKRGHRWVGMAVVAYMWLHILLGWGVSALFVAGITGLIKRD